MDLYFQAYTHTIELYTWPHRMLDTFLYQCHLPGERACTFFTDSDMYAICWRKLTLLVVLLAAVISGHGIGTHNLRIITLLP